MTAVTSSSPSSGAIDVPADEALTSAGIAELLEHGELRLLHVSETTIIAERQVLGVRGLTRRIVARQRSEHTWDVAHLIHGPGLYEHAVTDRRVGLATVTAVGIFVGGVLSVPVARAEVHALIGRAS